MWVSCSRGQGWSPSEEEAVEEAEVAEGGERLPLGSPGVGLGLGADPFWGIRERSALSWGEEPFGELGIRGGPWREVTELGTLLTLKNPMLFPR